MGRAVPSLLSVRPFLVPCPFLLRAPSMHPASYESSTGSGRLEVGVLVPCRMSALHLMEVRWSRGPAMKV